MVFVGKGLLFVKLLMQHYNTSSWKQQHDLVNKKSNYIDSLYYCVARIFIKER